MTQRGFTLLEMIVVMVLLGLVTTLALPAMQRWHDAVQVRARAATIVEALRAAAFAAGASRQESVMDERSFVAANAPASAADVGGTAVVQSADEPASSPRSRDAVGLMGASGPKALEIPLPTGWRVERVSTARFMANGLCSPGEALLRTEREELLSVLVRGPVCGAELATGQGQP